MGDLEWSLSSILKARQRLKSARAQQQKLLTLLNEVMLLDKYIMMWLSPLLDVLRFDDRSESQGICSLCILADHSRS